MSDFAWFKLMVRLVGILLIGLGLPMVLWHIGRLLAASVPSSPTHTSSSLQYELYSVGPGLLAYGSQLLMGLYLLLKGDWVIQKVLAQINGRCAVCGYDLSGIKGSSCPQCNIPFKRFEHMPVKVEEPGTPT
jgi:hypothetical protein